MAKELQGSPSRLVKQRQQRDADEKRGGDHGRLDEDSPVPAHVEGRQAVAAVVEVAHGAGEERHAQRGAQAGGEKPHRGGKRQVVQDQLPPAVAAGHERSYDGALLLDGGVGQHHEDEGHDDDDDVQERGPHGRVAGDVVGGVANALVGVGVYELVDARVGVGEGADHVLLGVGALGHGEASVRKAEGVRVGRGAPGGLQGGKALGRDLGHAVGERVDREVGVAGKEGLAVGQGEDARHGVGAPAEKDLVTQGETVVGCKDAVDGHLVVGGRLAPLAVGGEVHLRAVDVGAQRAVGAVVVLGVPEARVDGEVLVDVDAAHAVGRPAHGVELGVGGSEAGGHAAVLNGVLVAHTVHDDVDGVRGQQKARGQGHAAAHEQEDAEVLAYVLSQLAGEPPG